MSNLSVIAKEWIGTPWIHNQSVKGIGCDCVGFLIGIGKEADIISPDFSVENYHRIPRFNQIIEVLVNIETLEKVDKYQAEDILVIKFGSLACHVGLCLGDDFIHADNEYGVHITSMNFYIDKIVAIYRVKNGR